MNLKDYINKHKITHTEFGKIIKRSQGYVTLLVNRKKRPSPDLAFEIERLTNGEVTLRELLYKTEQPKENDSGRHDDPDNRGPLHSAA